MMGHLWVPQPFHFYFVFVIAVEADGRGRNCRYPSWFLAHTHWQTLDGRWTYNLHKNSTLRITNITQQHGSGSALPSNPPHSFSPSGVDSRQEQKAVCNSVVDLGDNVARVVAHLSQGWYVRVSDVPSSLSATTKTKDERGSPSNFTERRPLPSDTLFIHP